MTSAHGRTFYVYIMTNRSGTLYTGVTSNIEHRVFEHKTGAVKGFTKRYKLDRLLYFEEFDDAFAAIEREKQIKGGSRKKKIALISSLNPRGWTCPTIGFRTQPLSVAGADLSQQVMRMPARFLLASE